MDSNTEQQEGARAASLPTEGARAATAPAKDTRAASSPAEGAPTMLPPGKGASKPAPTSQQLAKIKRSAYIWNTVGGLLSAFQSVFMLMALMRVCDVMEAGVFTIAFASANLFLNLGKYGMRNYQVSDVAPAYSYRTYWRSRIVTTAAMIVFGTAYTAGSAITLGYEPDKTAVIIIMIVFKAADSIEDIYMGNCQQYGRLDVASKAFTWRMATTIALYVACVIAMHSQLVPLVIATAFTFAFCGGEYIWMKRRFDLPRQDVAKPSAPESTAALKVADKPEDTSSPALTKDTTIDLLKTCLPLFLAMFLLFYIGQAPKYAIDAIMDDAAQAYYGFIAMPVFIVSLLASFIYNPIVKSLADNWAAEERRIFLKRIGMQAIYIVAITAICDLGALLIGIPVLNILYNTQLEPYLADLIILVTGGGFLALATLFTMGITIMRQQKKLLVGYIGVAVLAAAGSPWSVSTAGIDGASWIYFATMTVLAIWFGAVLVKGCLSKQSPSTTT